MAHRSLPPSTDPTIDPFWHDAFAKPPRWWERVSAFRRPRRSHLVVVAGVIVAGAVGWWSLQAGAPPVETSLPMAGAMSSSGPVPSGGPATGGSTQAGVGADEAAVTTTGPPEHVVVQAAGAVTKPGVYTLELDARVDDLVEAAGGLTLAADLDRVNLAAPVTDGERIWVPSRGEQEVPEVVAGSGGGRGSSGAPGSTAAGSSDASAIPSTPIDLNAATAEELDSLPGVGPATAAAILAYREQNGPFASVEDLLDVRGIGDAKLEQLRPLVQV